MTSLEGYSYDDAISRGAAAKIRKTLAPRPERDQTPCVPVLRWRQTSNEGAIARSSGGGEGGVFLTALRIENVDRYKRLTTKSAWRRARLKFPQKYPSEGRGRGRHEKWKCRVASPSPFFTFLTKSTFRHEPRVTFAWDECRGNTVQLSPWDEPARAQPSCRRRFGRLPPRTASLFRLESTRCPSRGPLVLLSRASHS
jgi:hypothetical protein